MERKPISKSEDAVITELLPEEEEATVVKKAPMSDAERLELATKLDDDLNHFIDGLERKQYTEGWPEDRWEEEMDKHPFFMKKLPEEGDELHPLLEGIQQLKYDPMENTNLDLAEKYKEDGNYYVKNKKFNLAIYSYTEGIKQKCEATEINSVLFNNRSAAHFFLKNYRSSLADAKKALTYNANYSKAKWRMALCCSLLDRFDDCIEICDEILQNDTKNQSAIDLRKKCQTLKATKARDERKRIAAEKSKLNVKERILTELISRNVRFEEQRLNYQGELSGITEELLQPRLGPLEDFPVHFDEADPTALVWPIAFCYPEFLFSDFQQNVNENIAMKDILADMFIERLECDKNFSYRADNLNVYYENRIAGRVHKVNVTRTIREILSEKYFLVTGGCLTFYVVPIGSQVEKEYVNKLRRPQCN